MTELTKAVVDLGSFDAGKVPLTLKDSLTARLDRLGHAKDIAQVASVIGRQFSYAPLYAVAGMTEIDLRAALARLCRVPALSLKRGMRIRIATVSTIRWCRKPHTRVLRGPVASICTWRLRNTSKQRARSRPRSSPIIMVLRGWGKNRLVSGYWQQTAPGIAWRLPKSIANLQSALAEAERVA